ncbi:hypothetical protein [Halorarius halobius]|uniref:hypothetical protein n=1 Tax=Halorarius halobius TaxID=2962671 RepID=UPI0020CD283E|nr:hypothetical protein [Halorarius halobius]
MPSRRTLLWTVGTASLAATAGCSALDRGVPGYVQLKSIEGVRTDDGTRHGESILRVTLSSPPGGRPELSHVNDEWVDRFETPHTPTVSDALAADLSAAFDEVRYVVGVCSPKWADDGEPIGCYNVNTTRKTFDRAQVHDRVRASSDGTYLTVHAVDGEWNFE